RVAEIINRTFAPKHKKLISINLSLFPQETRETYFWGTLRDVFQRYESDVAGVSETFYDMLFLEGVEKCSTDFIATLFNMLQTREAGSMISRSIKVIFGIDTNQDLDRVREYFKFCHIIRIPSLSERKEDLVILIQALIEKYSRKYAQKIEGVSLEALKILLNYRWPGNSAELDAVIENMVLLSKGDPVLKVEALPMTLQMLEDNISKPGYNTILSLSQAKDLFEKELISFASQKFGVDKASALLKVHAQAA
ncbi:MAG: sigma 54-interacting transcriptional regulator, partial [Candidatus Margulisiibacteriota bacterium]